MFKKIFILCVIGIFLTGSVRGLTLKEFLGRPLPSAGVFVNKIIALAQWLWTKIVYISDIILNWRLDKIIAYLSGVINWFWQSIKSAFIDGWQLLLNIIKTILNESGINWVNLTWPWE